MNLIPIINLQYSNISLLSNLQYSSVLITKAEKVLQSNLNYRHVFFTLFFCRDGHIINVILNRDGHIINIILLFLYRDGHIINVILNRDGHIINIKLNRDGQSLGRKQKQVLGKGLSSVLRSQYTEEG